MSLLVITLIAVSLMAHVFPVGHYLVDTMSQWKTTRLASFVFVALSILYCTLGLPRQAMCYAAGLIFGVGEGFLLASVATIGGSAAGFVLMRQFQTSERRHVLRMRFEEKFPRLGRAVNEEPFKTVLMLRLMPIGSALFVTLASACYGLPLRAFALATLIGATPQNFIFVLIGAGGLVGNTINLKLGIALFFLSSLLALWLSRPFPEEKSSLR